MNELLIQIGESLAQAFYRLASQHAGDEDAANTYTDAADALSDAVDLLKESQ